jgi:hypothetical protein
MSLLWAALVRDRILKLKKVAAPKTFEGWFTMKFRVSRGSMDSLADKLLQCLGAKERAMGGSLCQNCEPTANQHSILVVWTHRLEGPYGQYSFKVAIMHRKM